MEQENRDILSAEVHCAFRSRGKTWVWEADTGFMRALCVKHRETRPSIAELGSICPGPRQPALWPQEGKGRSQKALC